MNDFTHELNFMYKEPKKPQWWIDERYDYCEDMKAFKVERTPILKRILDMIKGH